MFTSNDDDDDVGDDVLVELLLVTSSFSTANREAFNERKADSGVVPLYESLP